MVPKEKKIWVGRRRKEGWSFAAYFLGAWTWWGHNTCPIKTQKKHLPTLACWVQGVGGRKGKLQNQNNNKISVPCVPCVPCSPSLSKYGLRPRKLIISLCTESNQIGASAKQFIHVLNSYNPEGGKRALARSTK